MKHHGRGGRILLRVCTLVLAVGLLLPTGCSQTPTHSAASAAVGTWSGGALTYTLTADGNGQEIAGRHTSPVTWGEQGGVVTISVHDPTAPTADEKGRVSADRHTLTISQTSAKTWLLGRATQAAHR